MRLGPRSAAAAVATVLALVAAWASAQRADPRAPATFEVGAPRGPSPTERVTNQRTGLSPSPLPAGALRVEWRKSLGIPIEHAPVVRHDGTVAVLTSRGDVYVYDDAGDEKWRVTTGLSASSGPALLSDGTIAFATPGAELVGARAGQRRFQVRLPGDRPARITPVATDDGGLVVALAGEVLFVDAEGQPRARAPLPEPLSTGLVATGGRLFGAASSGAVYAISAGREATRVGSFGGAIDRGMAASSARTLVAVVDTSRLVELDVVSGVTQVRATAPVGHLLGPPAVHASVAYVTAYAPGRVYVLGYDG
ncbi:MAG: PQQ-binding-like beta-propeller repeat protein, partial [Myxococcales bacterium]|nr:PQQ-binding-like beta-propeller repeat protein [Myxococcales bacterium]